jgi:hypothetical protein
VLCGCLWAAKPLSTRSEPAKTSKLCLLEMLHTTIQMKKNFCLLGQKFFLKKFDENLYFGDHKTMLS